MPSVKCVNISLFSSRWTIITESIVEVKSLKGFLTIIKPQQKQKIAKS